MEPPRPVVIPQKPELVIEVKVDAPKPVKPKVETRDAIT